MNMLTSVWKMKCPRCREGNLFVKPFVLNNPLDMPKSCEVCHQRTEPEPGFYFGAMFLSYVFSGFYLLMPTLFMVFYLDWSVNAALATTIGVAALSYLKIMRLSRSLWIHMMVKYSPDKKIKNN